ncbi:molybdopterin-dependent oxidoreductase [Sneathiella sp. P13V-1]|uniref:xanthine dehydrogenase family protein molybdopterin-binding subunit n=1 Tax=Sneathiella sp. P13V-1 TaxID=2697366 RepID=UPI00187B3EE4|nr:xanthine dehydrogenase family protein molybdopterin-binding subunit [Sneathiella sp. P13V-1]MBE7638260.1 molybdopterin-dependent oxidoreductase [Sneathiella sp. P13V-1]
MKTNISRRGFLKSAATGSAVLVVGLNAKGLLAAGNETTDINPFVKINGDGTITVLLKHFEMGQGTTTGLTTLVAEELNADWSKVKTEFAPADNTKYANLFFGMQGTGGSTAIANSYMQYRQAGAAARHLLIEAVAKMWKVNPAEVRIENSILMHGNHKAHFGEFAGMAAQMTAPEKPTLKSSADFKLIGNPNLGRKDSHSKTNGTATFAIDVKVPGMVYAAIKRSPKFGGTVKSFDHNEAKSVGGFIDAKELPNKAGVVVFAKNTWAAFQGRDALTVEWDFSNAETRSSDAISADMKKLTATPEYNVRKGMTNDQVEAGFTGEDDIIEASFEFPFLAHAPMEPENCVIEPTDNGVLIHDGCQFPALTQPVVAQVLGLKPEQVEINTVYAGGSFGRRANPTSDYHMEAALAFALLGQTTPVKLVWSREDDIRGGYYRPVARHEAKIALNKDGSLKGWSHRVACKSVVKGTAFEAALVHEGVDHTSVEGIADSLYQIPDFAVGLSDVKSQVSTLWWRSVGHTHTAYAMESLMDMVAEKTGRDPIDLRLSLLNKQDPKQARFANVIETLKEKSGWVSGNKRGFAAHFSFNSYVAAVADVTVTDNQVHVDRIHVAVDCGTAINPDVIKAQMEGGVGYGLGAIFHSEITLSDGEVDQSNFPDYPTLRINEMPEIIVHIVPSTEAPTGVGEPAVPPTGPAVANAIYAITGKRITELPFAKAGFEFI